jgi:aromatic ring hydroxylase
LSNDGNSCFYAIPNPRIRRKRRREEVTIFDVLVLEKRDPGAVVVSEKISTKL